MDKPASTLESGPRAGSAVGEPGYLPRTADRWGPGLTLALIVHLLLVGGLALSVNWRSHESEAVEAEVWSEIPQVAAAPPPAARSEDVTPPTEPQAPTPPAPPAPAAEPETPPPDVVVARASPKEPKQRKHRQPREVFEDTKPVKPLKKTPPPEPEPKLAKAQPKPPPQAAARIEPTKGKAEPEGRSAAALEAQRKANLARMMASLDGSSQGTASRNAGPSASYTGRLIARIKPNIVFADNLSGNPTATVEVRCAPDGRIVSRKLLVSSGVPAWDEAVLRAVDRTEVFPADETGHVPSPMQLDFRPKDF